MTIIQRGYPSEDAYLPERHVQRAVRAPATEQKHMLLWPGRTCRCSCERGVQSPERGAERVSGVCGALARDICERGLVDYTPPGAHAKGPHVIEEDSVLLHAAKED